MKKLLRAVLQRSVRELTRIASVLALLGLAIMAYSILSPRPLPVVLAMSAGHVIGGAALVCYVLAILLTMQRNAAVAPGDGRSLPPPPEPPSEPPPADGEPEPPAG